MPDNLSAAGVNLFSLAAAGNFVQGRRTRSVAAVALYVACRCLKETQNTYMLIDFADHLNVSDL